MRTTLTQTAAVVSAARYRVLRVTRKTRRLTLRPTRRLQRTILRNGQGVLFWAIEQSGRPRKGVLGPVLHILKAYPATANIALTLLKSAF